MRVFLVNEMEFERGCGSRCEARYLFPTEEKAIEFCNAYNAKYNNQDNVPDWYMMQDYMGSLDVDKETFELRRYKGTLVKMPENWYFID